MSYRYLIVLLISLISICPNMCEPSPNTNENHDNDHDDNDHDHPEQHAYVPITRVINTPYGQQVITQQFAPDGSLFVHSSGPGYQGSSFQQGGYKGKDGNYHYSSMSSGNANQQYSAQFGNGMQMGSYQGQAMGGDGSGIPVIVPMKPFKFRPIKWIPMAPMAPMPTMAPFKWWPSIFENHDDDDDDK